MTAEEKDAIDRALLSFRQIECLALFVRNSVPSEPALCDAIGGIETFSGYAADQLDRAIYGGPATAAASREVAA